MNWLFLRGLTREQRHWGRFRVTFGTNVPNAHVYCLDLPGTGTESSRTSPSDVTGIADDLRNRWLRLRSETEGDWALLAISLGGMVGMDWIHRYPSDFSRFVMINSSAANLSGPFDRLKGSMLPGLIGVAATRDPFLKERAVLSMTTEKTGSELHEIAHEWANYARENPMNPKVALSQITAAARFRAPEKLEIPVLVLSSAKDRFTDPSCSQKLAERFAAPIRVHPTAGHDLPLEQSAWVATQVNEWIEGVKKT